MSYHDGIHSAHAERTCAASAQWANGTTPEKLFKEVQRLDFLMDDLRQWPELDDFKPRSNKPKPRRIEVWVKVGGQGQARAFLAWLDSETCEIKQEFGPKRPVRAQKTGKIICYVRDYKVVRRATLYSLEFAEQVQWLALNQGAEIIDDLLVFPDKSAVKITGHIVEAAEKPVREVDVVHDIPRNTSGKPKNSKVPAKKGLHMDRLRARILGKGWRVKE